MSPTNWGLAPAAPTPTGSSATTFNFTTASSRSHSNKNTSSIPPQAQIWSDSQHIHSTQVWFDSITQVWLNSRLHHKNYTKFDLIHHFTGKDTKFNSQLTGRQFAIKIQFATHRQTHVIQFATPKGRRPALRSCMTTSSFHFVRRGWDELGCYW
jgi:hypothetical protein